MADRRGSTGAQKSPQPTASGGIRKRSASSSKAKLQGVRRSARLSAAVQPTIDQHRRRRLELDLPSGEGLSQDQEESNPSHTPSGPFRKRTRGQEAQHFSPLLKDSPPSKRPRTSGSGTSKRQPERAGEEDATASAPLDPIENWVLHKRWAIEYLKSDYREGEGLFDRDSWLEERMAQPAPPVVQYIERNGFRLPLPIKKAPASLRRKQSDSSLTGSSDQTKRESKSTQYRDTRYTTLLAGKGSFLHNVDYRPVTAVADLCQQLLTGKQDVPKGSLFDNDLFGRVCEKIRDRNEAMIIQDITRLIVPSAVNLAIYGAKHLDVLTESVNEAWTGSVAVEGPRPQPDYAVGFDPSAFAGERREKLGQLIGSVFDTSFFVATYRMYFPFLTCEVKCGAAALDVADRQNAHSMTIAARSIIELYRAVKREKELDREIVSFSITHDQSVVRLYGHYAVITDSNTTFYRHPIKEFSFTTQEGAEKWTAYKFTRNVYDVWMPTHFKRICSAIDQLPSGLDFQVSQGPLAPFETSELPHESGLLSGASDAEISSQIGPDESTLAEVQAVTPDTSISRGERQGAAKRAKKDRNIS